jgi:hypothetical protein
MDGVNLIWLLDTRIEKKIPAATAEISAAW